MEALAAGSAIVGVVTAALHSTRLLYDDFKSIRSADKNIEPVVEDLSSICKILASLDKTQINTTEREEGLQGTNSENLKAAAGNCNKICERFRTKLAKWTKHSTNTDNRMDWRDKFVLGFLAEKDILELRAQLAACKGTFVIALQMTTIISSSNQAQKADTIIKMLEAKELEINRVGSLTEKHINVINHQLKRLGSNEQAPSEETSQTQITASQLEVDNVFHKTWKGAKSEIESRLNRIGKVIEGNDAKVLVGIHGLNGSEGKIYVDIDDISVGDRSKAAIGVTRGLDLNAFFK